jgi:phage repressor protein C with HTH and peptisase S24 domain
VKAPDKVCVYYALTHKSQRIDVLFTYAFKTTIIDGMAKMTIHTILAGLIARDGISPTELSRRSGVGQSTLSRILKGEIKTPTDEQVNKLATYFRMTTDQLRGRGPVDADNLTRQTALDRHAGVTQISVWDDGTPLSDDEIEVPFLKEVELAAGSGRTAVQESGDLKLRFGLRSLRKQGVQPENAVCVQVAGNSMEPVLRHGATVGVDRGAREIVDGDMYAINHDGQLRVKQVYRLPGGGIRLRSFNRDEHPDEEYRPDEIRDSGISVIGRVFWWAMFA